MPAGLRFWAFLAAAALAVAGVQLGATLQLEQWLETSLDLADENAQRNTGNFVFATAILAAAGAAACVAALSRLPLRRRLRPAAAVAAGTYVLLVMAQTAMTTVLAVRPEGGQGQAQLAVNPFVAHAYATPSVLVPLLGLAAGAAALAAWGLVRLWRPSEPSLAGVHRLQLAATATAAPLCVVGAVGSLRLMTEVAGLPGGTAYHVLLPVQATALLALLYVGWARARATASALHEPRMRAAAQESHAALLRVELTLLAALLATAALAVTLRGIELPALRTGYTFILTARTHAQLLVVAALPLAAGPLLHGRLAQGLERHLHAVPSAPKAGGLAAATLGGLAGAAVLTLTTASTTWPWLAATVPVAAWAAASLGPARAAPLAAATGLVLWGLGNSVAGAYTFVQFSDLDLHREPGELALWRVLAAALAGFAVARAVRGLGRGSRARDAVPAAVLAGASVALLILVELPVSAWIDRRPSGDALAAGSLVHSLDPVLRAGLRGLDAILAVVAAAAVARLLRPDWFTRRRLPQPQPAVLATRIISR